jgi:hypothetical protein
MAEHCDKACNKPVYKETVKVYERCAVVDCAYTEVIVTETQDTEGNLTTVLTDKEGNPLPEGTKFFECADPVNAIVCAPSVEPPEPITLEGEDCDGAVVEVTGMPGQLMSVVQAKDTVFKVQLCNDPKDTEKVVLCDKNTDHKVAVITDLTDPSSPVVTFWDLNTGAPWVGDVDDLVACADIDLESDGTDMCDAGTPFLRWYIKKNGEPTGDYFDTDLGGQPYVVTDEAGVTRGECVPAVVCEPGITSAFANDLSTLQPGHSVAIQKTNCCAIKVTTSAGSFIVSKDVTGYSTGNFDCPVTVTAVDILSGTCDKADIVVTTQKIR